MKEYLELLQDIIDNGVEKESGRANMPNTIGISNAVIKMDLQNGFPLLTTKKMYLKGIIYELLWFLHGDTNIKYLVDNNVNIWNGDAYRWYLKTWGDSEKVLSMNEFLFEIKSGRTGMGLVDHNLGDLGKVYGYNWRNIPKKLETASIEKPAPNLDQVSRVIEGLKNNPYSRYHIINAWDIRNFDECALMPCHLLYQFIVRPLKYEERCKLNTNEHREKYDKNAFDFLPKFYLDLNMYQRSADTLLGVPFNLASMSCLLKIFAQTCNMIPGVSTWIGGDTHLYVNHVDLAKMQIEREPYALPKLHINKELNGLEDILQLKYEDFELIDYKSHPAIKAELFTGLKK